jgi:hypothetical protein
VINPFHRDALCSVYTRDITHKEEMHFTCPATRFVISRKWTSRPKKVPMQNDKEHISKTRVLQSEVHLSIRVRNRIINCVFIQPRVFAWVPGCWNKMAVSIVKMYSHPLIFVHSEGVSVACLHKEQTAPAFKSSRERLQRTDICTGTGFTIDNSY